MRYYYPDDVVKLPNGETTVGFYVGTSPDGSVVAHSLLPVKFTAEDASRIEALYFRIWEDARDRARKDKAEEFLRNYHQRILDERDCWEKFHRENPKAGITAWRIHRQEVLGEKY